MEHVKGSYTSFAYLSFITWKSLCLSIIYDKYKKGVRQAHKH